MRTLITARLHVPGLHYWPGAHDARDYVRAPHRHLFGIAATLEVRHDERDVEWHDLAETMTAHVRDMADRHRDGLHDFGPRSCETLARTLMARLTDDGHTVAAVEWDEDGEFTARIEQA